MTETGASAPQASSTSSAKGTTSSSTASSSSSGTAKATSSSTGGTPTATASASTSDTQKQIDELKAQLQKQRKVITDTAQQLLKLQLAEAKNRLSAIPNPANLASGDSEEGKDATDFVTNKDLVQLVAELQGQLNILDQKSIRRVANVQALEDSDKIYPLPNSDGELPANFPATLGEFKALNNGDLISLSAYYDLLPETAEQEARMKAFIEGKIKSPNTPTEFKADEYSKEQLAEFYSELRFYCGIMYSRD